MELIDWFALRLFVFVVHLVLSQLFGSNDIGAFETHDIVVLDRKVDAHVIHVVALFVGAKFSLLCLGDFVAGKEGTNSRVKALRVH